jgi:excinuclease ABC subunit C
LIAEAGYRERVKRVELFLRGRGEDLLRGLRAEMEAAAARLDFERAGELRDTVGAIEKTVEQQKTVASDETDRDVVGVFRAGDVAMTAVLCIRAGRLLGRKLFPGKAAAQDDAAIVRELFLMHYLGDAFIPAEIILPAAPDDMALITSLLRERRGSTVKLLVPKRGIKRKLVAMAETNAEEAFGERERKARDTAVFAAELQRRFHLPRPACRVECVDISNIQGAEAVGSVAVFCGREPKKELYRRYAIQSVAGADDCGMIYEVVRRRVERGRVEGSLPDLMVVDGGRGQLSAARRALQDAAVDTVSVIAIAKERTGAGEALPDRIFRENRKNPLLLKQCDRVSHFLQALRDEAHRFAIRYHREKRERKIRISALTGVEGVGEKRKKLLLRHFSGLDEIARASIPDLEKVLNNKRVAERIYHYFHERRRREGG